MQRIMPCLWFDKEAEEAAKFYTSIVRNSKILTTARYGKAAAEVSGQPEDSVMTVTFELDGYEFMALNGGPMFTFSPATSFMIHCQTQEEIDELWAKLSEGGAEEQCGWLKDRYGVSWQIVPALLDEIAQQDDPEAWERAMKAMLPMKKLDLE
ncbi:MAG TPA: VOC family protein, partial [Thermoanaerobaculia bacterium]|nr:VOC family protein [Thermoanaerobaculia bacterium]